MQTARQPGVAIQDDMDLRNLAVRFDRFPTKRFFKLAAHREHLPFDYWTDRVSPQIQLLLASGFASTSPTHISDIEGEPMDCLVVSHSDTISVPETRAKFGNLWGKRHVRREAQAETGYQERSKAA